MSARILVVEDESDIRRLESFVLEQEGYEVMTAATGSEALDAARDSWPDLIVLDIVIPAPDGLRVCEMLRDEGHYCPILFVTARKEQWQQIAGLAQGADHYIVKPFSPAYLTSVVRAALRREELYRGALRASPHVRIADVDIDVEAHLVRRDREDLHLTPGEWIVLKVLIDQRGSVVPRDQILERLWDTSTDEGINSRTVDMHISRLRQKLGETAGSEIVTARNFGYRLNRGSS